MKTIFLFGVTKSTPFDIIYKSPKNESACVVNVETINMFAMFR